MDGRLDLESVKQRSPAVSPACWGSARVCRQPTAQLAQTRSTHARCQQLRRCCCCLDKSMQRCPVAPGAPVLHAGAGEHDTPGAACGSIHQPAADHPTGGEGQRDTLPLGAAQTGRREHAASGVAAACLWRVWCITLCCAVLCGGGVCRMSFCVTLPQCWTPRGLTLWCGRMRACSRCRLGSTTRTQHHHRRRCCRPRVRRHTGKSFAAAAAAAVLESDGVCQANPTIMTCEQPSKWTEGAPG